MSDDQSVPSNVDGELRALAKGTGQVLLASVLLRLLSVVIGPVFARHLNAAGYGSFRWAQSTSNLVYTLVLLGIPSAVTYFAARMFGQGDFSGARRTIARSLVLAVGVTGLGGLLLAVLARPVAGRFVKDPGAWILLAILALWIPLTAIQAVLGGAAQARRNNLPILVGRVVAQLAGVGCFLALFWNGLGVSSAALATVLGAVASCAVTAWMAWPLFRSKEQRVAAAPVGARELLGFSIPNGLKDMTSVVWHSTSTMVLGALASVKDVGLYNAADQVAGFGSFPLTAMNTLFRPIVADLYHRGDIEGLAQIHKTSTKWVIALTLPMMTFAVLERRVVLGIFGPEFVAAEGPLLVLAVGYMLNAATGNCAALLLMSRWRWAVLADTIVCAVVNIAACYLLTRAYGSVGAALASSLAVVLVNVILVVQGIQFMGIHPYRLTTLKPILAALVCGVPLLFFPARNMQELVLTFAAYAILYLGATLLLGLDEHDKVILRAFRQRIPWR